MTDKLIVSRSEIEANLDLLIYEHTGFNVNQHYDQDMIKSIKNLVNAILDKAEKSQVEPVGYVITGKLGDRCSFKATNLNKGDTIYTSPPADKQDAERLDYMLNNGARVGSFTANGVTKYRLEANGVASDWANTPREAIDAAMKGE